MTKAEAREARDDIRSEIEDIDADLIGYREDLRRAKEDIAEAKARKLGLKTKLAELSAISGRSTAGC